MSTRTVGRTTVTLPEIDPAYLAPVDSLVSSDTVRDFMADGHDLRALDLVDGHLQSGRISRLSTRGWTMEGTTVSNVEILDCDTASLAWTGAKTRQTVFRNCALMGARISEVAFDDSLFEDCRLTYATFDRVRALGPVAFVRCQPQEATLPPHHPHTGVRGEDRPPAHPHPAAAGRGVRGSHRTAAARRLHRRPRGAVGRRFLARRLADRRLSLGGLTGPASGRAPGGRGFRVT
ncbi:hypothetical protein ACGFRB_02300 [Streptomyces sp. NPDC048718]|uniref:hypothetical protein n=1 Tax=Streptomyces sp. NPDC048718 TaxID=3365587 RepID=UPI00371F77AA